MSEVEKSLTQAGNTVGSTNVTLSQNQPNVDSDVIEITVPERFEEIEYDGGQHNIRWVPRTKEVASGDGTTATFSLSTDLIRIAGEEQVSEQDTPVLVAYDSAAGSKLTVDSVDYAADQVTFASAPSTGTDNVHMFPVLASGRLKIWGVDQFGNKERATTDFGFQIRNFADKHQRKEGSRPHIPGGVEAQQNERIALTLDSGSQVVWEDSNYPNGQYVSTLEIDADVRY